jgi:hypothetical protein
MERMYHCSGETQRSVNWLPLGSIHVLAELSVHCCELKIRYSNKKLVKAKSSGVDLYL